MWEAQEAQEGDTPKAEGDSAHFAHTLHMHPYLGLPFCVYILGVAPTL